MNKGTQEPLTRLFVEGGGNSELNRLCRVGLQELLKKAGFEGHIPKIVACGSRNEAFKDFCNALKNGENAFLLVDSEDPIADPEKVWEHLQKRDEWRCDKNPEDSHIFLMTTCMETWIVADRATLKTHYKNLQENALPTRNDLENETRKAVQQKLETATKTCTNAYRKGKRSFEVLGKVNPQALQSLPAYARMVRLLQLELPQM